MAKSGVQEDWGAVDPGDPGEFEFPEAVTWKDVNPQLLSDFVHTVSKAGVLLTLSVSSQSGALGINAYYKSEPHRFFPGTAMAAESLMKWMIANKGLPPRAKA